MKIGSLPEMFRRFRRDQRGNVLMLFGLALVPLMGVIGVAIDYSRASNARQALNAAIDSAALMAARDAQKLTDGQLRTRIEAWIRDNLPPHGTDDQDRSELRCADDDLQRARHDPDSRGHEQPVDLGNQQDRARAGAR
jgi:type II secretory pathway pseudopilin PulG